MTEKNCPVCNHILKDNCFIKDSGVASLSNLELIIKDDNLKKTTHELKCRYCPNCGHVELYIDLK